VRRLRRASFAATGLAGFASLILLPALASAHPLGNFTINHYAGVRVEPDRVLLDVVVDQAEIPTFQARLEIDDDGDGEISDDEAVAGGRMFCATLGSDLRIEIDGADQTPVLEASGLTFPPGVGGLSTMRSVCEFVIAAPQPFAAGTRFSFVDPSFADRLGWREIVVEGSGVAVSSDDALRTTSSSARLTSYPTDLLTQALADDEVSFRVSPGGPTLAPLAIADAQPLTAAPAPALPSAAPASTPTTAPEPALAPVAAVVPGGVAAGELPEIFRSTDLSPVVLIVSLLTAAALGAGHALTPGHGKTLMAAYLVGTRGTAMHAVGLGLSVTFSHTLGILVLAAVVVGAQGMLAPDLVVKTAPIVAAISIVTIGGWMLLSEGRRRWRARAAEQAHRSAHLAGEDHDHEHDHDRSIEGPEHAHGEHRHGGVTHSHLPPAGATISWRSLFVLGLAGGLIPSTSALLILLGSIAAGRPAFGFVLVVAFGLGMAIVLGGVGFALVMARGRLDRVDPGSVLGRASGFVPLAAAVLVFGLGMFLTIQAVAGTTVL
jgi:nickel/cobalt transporter (NicO) family protein